LVVLNYSPATVKHRLFYLRRFFAWLAEGGVKGLAGVRVEVIRDYQAHLYEQVTREGEPWGVLTQNNALQAVKGFFGWLLQEDYVASDPTRNVAYARRPKRLPRSILTAGEVKKLLKAPDTKTALGYRDRAILELMYSTGLRRDEVNCLMIEDVDYEEGFVRVNGGKGAKDRVVPLGKIACRWVESYVKAVRPMLSKDHTKRELFVSLRGGKMSKNVLWGVVKRSAEKAGVKKSVSPHTFRHTCATLMMRNKANLRHVQELLGHGSLNTTQVYTAVTAADLKEVHRKCHPREKERS